MALATGFAMFVRFGTTDATEGNVSYVAIGLAATVAWPALLGLSGAYDLRSSLFGVEELRRVLRAALLLLASAGLAHIGFRLNLSRGYFLALLPTAVVVTAAARSAVRRVLSRPGDDLRSHRVVAVGPADDIVRFCEDLDRTQTRGQVEVVAFVADDLAQTQAAPPALRAMQRLPDRNAIRDVATHVDVDMLVRAGRPGPDEMWALGQRAHDLGVTVAIAPHRDDATSSVALTYVPLGSTPLLMVENPTLRPAAVLVKAVFDRSAALVLMIVLAPVFAAIALTIAVRDGRPVFFRQERVGRYGTRFSCWKFRTMHVDAEQRRDELLGRNEASGLLFKVKDDPRVTPTGRLLRRHSLDELPQLLNVLTGQMSIVGPRPPLPYEVEAYDARTHRRLNVKPGITGLWQTQGRSNLPWDDGIYLDLLYIDHWSPLLDLVIMARTVRTVIRPEGAY
jgi:exopolysaccharide biosynthesis polyprenyl glycosylphosphotransferase